MSLPNPPGSPEARAIIAAFKARQCQHVYKDAHGGRCCERARYPVGDPKWCLEHNKGKRQLVLDQPARWGQGV